jgi:Ca-activated chloride channel family protein
MDARADRNRLSQNVAPLGNAPGLTGDVIYSGTPPEPLPAEELKENRDQFEAFASNAIKQVAAEPVSTFSIDVDTASYGFARRSLMAGRMPPKDAIRVEEMINYFPYDYPRPESAAVPFQPTVTVMPAPWKPTNKLVHIGIKGYDIAARERPRANLVFLIDVSGSMAPEDRLPLLKNAFRMLLDEIKPDDTVGIVTYASHSGIALEPTRVAERGKIADVLSRLHAGGSTAGGEGLQNAYKLAEMHFDKTAVNRIILATDGDFNVGISDHGQLKNFIEAKRQSGIYLSVIGVGQDNYNDRLMQTLAQNGNGVAAYVDTLNEARKVLVDEASSALFTIAKDVKIQVEFNPAQVSEYRLIGYETRALKREDFNNDHVDAGEIGSGHTVTAIYEVTPVGAPKFVDDLRYGKPQTAAPQAPSAGGELGYLKIRYKLPSEDVSKPIALSIAQGQEIADIQAAPEDVRFSVAVAAFGQLLRGEPYTGGFTFDSVLALAQPARGADPFGYRAEFLNLVRLAKAARH